MILAPNVTVQVGGIPPVRCYIAERAEGYVPRFDIPDEGFGGLSAPLLREWFEQHGQSGPAGIACTALCVTAAEAVRVTP